MVLEEERYRTESPVNAMTVDVEDYFHVSAFERYIPANSWTERECRLPANIAKILDLFEAHRISATFFTLGWVAERYPELVKNISDRGHEIASHGYRHVRVTQQNRDQFSEDVIKTRKLLEDVSGQAVSGYRAASYSIGADNLWALDALQEAGYHYSSSIYPVHHDLYGMPDAPRFPFRVVAGGLLEIPVSTIRFGSRNFACGGGGFFRLYPYQLSRWALRRVNGGDCQPAVFYFHPWELDPDQPRLEGLPIKTRLRHYLNLSRFEKRLERLLKDFRWASMSKIFCPV